MEPSARAREVERRLRERSWLPEGPRTYSPARPRRRTGWYVTGLVAAVALLVVGLFPQQVVGWFGGNDGGQGRPLAAGSDLRPTLAEPFRGSPAAAGPTERQGSRCHRPRRPAG